MKKNHKRLLIVRAICFCILTLFFSIVFFAISNDNIDYVTEESFIEISEPDIDINVSDEEKSKNTITKQEINKIIRQKIREPKEPNINYTYHPHSHESDLGEYKILSTKIFLSDYLKNKFEELNIAFHEESFGIRGKMKNKSLNFYDTTSIDSGEFLSVGVHEFAHFFDIYMLEKKVLNDISSYFYNISWDSTKVIKEGMTPEDFVSGYSMSNKYEDFAESMTYYMFHNSDFVYKSESSEVLKSKYDFFTNFVFRDEEFLQTDFSDEIIQNYYWDITKINIDLKKLLQYLEK